MTSDNHFAIDYRVWAEYWDLLEHDGLDAGNAPFLKDFISGPILLLGSGQGLMSEYFSGAGCEVCNVDRSPEMAVWATRRRGVSTIVSDAMDLPFTRRFRTVVISTGVINERTLDENTLPLLLANIDNHLMESGYLILTYFRVTSWTAAAHTLRLYGRPSKNSLFWTAQGDLPTVEQLFIESTEQRQAVHSVFAEHHARLTRQMDIIMSIGRRFVDVNGESPVSFIEYHSGFYPFSLSSYSEGIILKTLKAQKLSPMVIKTLNGGDTKVLVCERYKR